MMDISLQIEIAFFLAAVIGIPLIFLMKKSRMMWIVSFLFCMAAGLIIWKMNAISPRTAKQEQKSSVVTEEDAIRLSYALSNLESGGMDFSKDVLDEYIENGEYNDSYILAKARCGALAGNSEEAGALYQLLIDTKSSVASEEQLEKEKEAVGDAADDDINPIAKAVAEEVKDLGQEEETLIQAFLRLQEMKQEDTISKSELEQVKQSFDQTGEQPSSFRDTKLMQKAELELNYLSVDQDALITNAYENHNTEDIMVLSELNRTGALPSDTIMKNEAVAKEVKDNEATLKWLEKQQKKYTYSEKAEQFLSDAIHSLQEASQGDADQQVSYWLESRLLEAAADDSETEQSRIYAQLSRIEYQKGNNDQASLYLMNALQTSSQSKDPAYSGPVNEINDIIADKEDSEQLKNLYEYATMMADHVFENELYNSSYHYDSGSDALVKQIMDTNSTYAQNVSNDASKMAASVNIVSIDASKFEQVSSVIAVNDNLVSSEEDFKKHMEIYDCANHVTDYQVERVNYQDINIVLCCDNSGSMEGDKIENLKNAINVFAQNVEPSVRIGLVPFSAGVDTEHVFSLQQAGGFSSDVIEAMGALGGTDIFSGVEYSIDMLKGHQDDLNIIILMSDGQDDGPSAEEIEYLKNAYASNGITLYSMGLGSDVDANLLSSYSDIGGGDYVYVDSPNSLYSFYEYIYQLCKNRFKIIYTAMDTLKTSRYLEADVANSQLSDTKEYYLYDQDITEEDLGDPYAVTLDDVVVEGLETRLMYTSTIDQITSLKGKNLKKDSGVSVSLHGNMQYDLSCEYTDDNTWKVTVPGKVAVGIYDVYVTVGDRRAVLDAGFVMSSREVNVVKYGDYVFTATGVEKFNESITMTGYVTMNNWLGFPSGVTLDGYKAKYSKGNQQYTDDETPEVVMSCKGKPWVQYKAGQTKGFSDYLAKKGIILNLPGISSVTLYNDPTVSSTSDDYPTEAAVAGPVYLVDLVEIHTPGMRIYPDRVKIDFNEFTTKLPMVDQIIKCRKQLFSVDEDNKNMAKVSKRVENEDPTSPDYNKPSYETDIDLSAIISAEGIDCAFQLKIEQEDQETKAFKSIGCFGNMPVYLNLTNFEISFDTKEGEFGLKIITDVAFLTDGLGVEMNFKSCHLDEVKLYCNKEIHTTVSGVPVTFSDFMLGASNLPDEFSFKDVMDTELTGACDVDIAKLSGVFPEVVKKAHIKDQAFATLDNVTLKFSLGQRYIELTSGVKIIGFSIGNIGLKLGSNMSYTSALLNMDDEKVSGIIASVAAGPDWEEENTSIKINAGVEVALTTKVLGLTASGEFKVSLSWWVLVKDFHANGNLFVGTYVQHNGQRKFGAMGQDNSGGSFTAMW